MLSKKIEPDHVSYSLLLRTMSYDQNTRLQDVLDVFENAREKVNSTLRCNSSSYKNFRSHRIKNFIIKFLEFFES